MSAVDDTKHPLMAWQIGEGIDPADFETQDDLLRMRWWHELPVHGEWSFPGMLSNANNADFIGTNHPPGPEDFNYDVNELLWSPRPCQFFNAPESKVFLTTGNLRLLYHADSSLPPGYLSIPGGTTLTAPSASLPATNPRWDTLWIDPSVADGEAENRDFEDAATRALTTQSVNKRRVTDQTHGWTSGSEAALPDFPAISAGRRRLLSIRRTVGEGGTLTKTDIALHAYPTRLRVETIWGSDAGYNSTKWDRTGDGTLIRTGTTFSDFATFRPRLMHSGCRLVGIAVCTSNFAAVEFTTVIRRFNITSGGSMSTTDLVDMDTDIQPNGLHYIGETDWTTNAGIAAGSNAAYPIWGNGYTYGPLFADDDRVASPIAHTNLEVAIGGSGTWDAGELLHFVRFIYLY